MNEETLDPDFCSLQYRLDITPVISDLCTGQQMELAVKTLDP